MTLAWAIITVAVLYLIDKHHLWKKALIAAGVLACLYVLGIGGLVAYQWLKPKWEEHVWATHHDCFNPFTGRVHKTNGHPTPCQWDEELHDRDTPLPVVAKCERAGKTPAPEASSTPTPPPGFTPDPPPGFTPDPPPGFTPDPPPLFEVDVPNNSKHYWQDGHWCQPSGPIEPGESNPDTLPADFFTSAQPGGIGGLPGGSQVLYVPPKGSAEIDLSAGFVDVPPKDLYTVPIPPGATIGKSDIKVGDAHAQSDYGPDKVVTMTGAVIDVFEYSDSELKRRSLKCQQASSCWFYVSFEPKGWTDWSLTWYGGRPTLSRGDCAVMQVRAASGRWMTPAQDAEHLPKLLSYEVVPQKVCSDAPDFSMAQQR